MRRLVLALTALIVSGPFVEAADSPSVDRKLGKEPEYLSKRPGYALLTFGERSADRVWLVRDGDTLFVDRNGNSDLTDAGEKVAAEKQRPGWAKEEGRTFEVGELNVGGRTHKGLVVQLNPMGKYPIGTFNSRPDVQAILAKDPQAMTLLLQLDADLPNASGGGIDGRRTFTAGPLDLNGMLQFGPSAATAPVIHIGGPLEVSFCFERPELRLAREVEFVLVVGSPGDGPGTFAMLAYEGTIPKTAHPAVEVTFAPVSPGAVSVVAEATLKDRCCTDNLRGRVSAPANAGSGHATVKLSFTAWGDGRVAPTTHEINVLPPGPGLKSEAVAASLVASLGHADPSASMFSVQFSPDGQRLFASGYPSGIVQLWDWQAQTEIHTITTPSGYRGSSEFALLTPDWKTLYVPVEQRSVKPIERDGKRLSRIEVAGAIRIWNVASGVEQPPLESPADSAPLDALMSPEGQFLISMERSSYDAVPGVQPRDETIVWNLATRQRRKLCDGFQVSSFLPGGNTLAAVVTDYGTRKSAAQILDFATGKPLALTHCPDQERYFARGGSSPDGAVVAVLLGGKLGAPGEVWLLDGKTLAERGKFVGPGDPQGYGWVRGAFSPDSRSYVILDGQGQAHVWDTTAGKVSRTFDIGQGSEVGMAQQLAFSRDSATLAVGWFPPFDRELARREPDPRDLPQPRVTVIDLAGASEPRVLVSRHGYVGGLAFSPDGKTLAFGSSGAVHLFDLTK